MAFDGKILTNREIDLAEKWSQQSQSKNN